MPDRPLPALPDAPRPKSVYEHVRLKTTEETTARSSSMNNLAGESVAEGLCFNSLMVIISILLLLLLLLVIIIVIIIIIINIMM